MGGCPLQNRVTPSGEIISDPARGLFMGNRGGRLHDPATKTLSARRWVSRRWICCVTRFGGRRREVMGDSYTELFFLDEVTALAAGHRPCFECRRACAGMFAKAFAQAHGLGSPPTANEMDLLLHQNRLDGRTKRTFKALLSDLPDGAMVRWAGQPHGKKDGRLWKWTPGGYSCGPDRDTIPDVVDVLTPRTICKVLDAGYTPAWHASAAE
ncbi:hypothetical protein GCM10011316_26170 [Roseibium aquae]|uniref:Uncharacterized protein n=1 Tax=Roseibium aquae TaxID=1323746 RepID=A0A916TLJ3_9HYPH|nr:hypothetical protein [Roseibium aquae]GGB52888.1 hypothetical protein GCM10011316_26170 [Roseibium aquae]